MKVKIVLCDISLRTSFKKIVLSMAVLGAFVTQKNITHQWYVVVSQGQTENIDEHVLEQYWNFDMISVS